MTDKKDVWVCSNRHWAGDVSGAFVDLCRDHDELVVQALRKASVKIADGRLDRIITECRNNISGADEDKSRDMLLTEIIRIAEGE